MMLTLYAGLVDYIQAKFTSAHQILPGFTGEFDDLAGYLSMVYNKIGCTASQY